MHAEQQNSRTAEGQMQMDGRWIGWHNGRWKTKQEQPPTCGFSHSLVLSPSTTNNQLVSRFHPLPFFPLLIHPLLLSYFCSSVHCTAQSFRSPERKGESQREFCSF